MVKKTNILKEALIYVGVFIFSFSMCKISVLNNYIFVVPFILFCFFYKKSYGVVAFVSSFLFIGFVSSLYLVYMVVLGVSFLFIVNFIKSSNKKLKNILCVYVFFSSFILGIVNNLLNQDNMFALSFFCGVVSYWVMNYYYELYLAMRKSEEYKLDARLSSFLFIVLGVFVLGLNLSVGQVNISYILLLLLSFVGVRVGLDVGSVYTLTMLGIILFYTGVNYDLIFFALSFLMFFFFSKVTKITMFFTYAFAIFFSFYYLKLSYIGVLDYLLAALLFVLIPSSLLRGVCKTCYGSEAYIQKLKEDSKSFNLKIANKIVKMEEVFSLVCEKINIKERIKKNDRKLLVEEVNIFSDLLKNFSNEIKLNYNFDSNYFLERELYKYDLDLISFNVREDIFNNKAVNLEVRCGEIEIKSVVIPLINKIFNNKFEVNAIKYNDIFGYYSILLKEKKRKKIVYGISQKSFDNRVCGDSYLVYENDKYYVFAISDGMGVGKIAKESSKLALDLFQKFMNIGFSLEQTLRSVNSILVEKYSKDNYSTLDLFVCDKLSEKYYVCKNGASDSYLLGERKEVIKGNELPLGIIDKKEYVTKEINLCKGDMLLMASDGVGELDVLKLDKIKNKNCQKISEMIIDMSDEINDDKTVFVIKVC